jgi:hypothetical protein
MYFVKSEKLNGRENSTQVAAHNSMEEIILGA